MLVNHLGLTLTEEDMQNVVDLMEPYGQINNGVELLSPPLDVCVLSNLLRARGLWSYAQLIRLDAYY